MLPRLQIVYINAKMELQKVIRVDHGFSKPEKIQSKPNLERWRFAVQVRSQTPQVPKKHHLLIIFIVSAVEVDIVVAIDCEIEVAARSWHIALRRLSRSACGNDMTL